jgi:hypothetical protein
MVQVIYRCTWFRLSKEHKFRLFIGAKGSGLAFFKEHYGSEYSRVHMV